MKWLVIVCLRSEFEAKINELYEKNFYLQSWNQLEVSKEVRGSSWPDIEVTAIFQLAG